MRFMIRKRFLDSSFEKAYKYIRRYKKNNKWFYVYPNGVTEQPKKALVELAKKTKLITGIRPLDINSYGDLRNYINILKQKSEKNELKCPALGNVNIEIEEDTYKHFVFTHGKMRPFAETQHKAAYLPFVQEILKNGILCEKSKSKEGVIYGVCGQIQYFNKKENKIKKEMIELAINFDKESKKFLFSVSSDIEIKKSLLLTGI